MRHVRARRPKTPKLAGNPRLCAQVQAMPDTRWSPERQGGMQVSHETIYQAIYVQGRGALRPERAVCLRAARPLAAGSRSGSPGGEPDPPLLRAAPPLAQRPPAWR
jgi:IS30 family transposase